MVEYAVLLAGVAMVGFVMVGMLGSTVQGLFVLAEEELQDNIITDDPALGCPPGWDLVANTVPKKGGGDVDSNGDGMVCRKIISGEGRGNTGGGTNVKDNNN